MVYVSCNDGYLYAVHCVSSPGTSNWPMFRHDRSRSGRVAGK